MSARVGIVVFPGSNCEFDCRRAFNSLGAETTMVWHNEPSLPDVDLVVLPGGFAHGDYIRTGALARFSPIMDAVRRHGHHLTPDIGSGVNVGAMCEQGADHVRMTLGGGPHQGGLATRGLRVDARALAEQRFDYSGVARS